MKLIEILTGVAVLVGCGYGILAVAAIYHYRNYLYITKGPSKDVKRGATECVGRVQ